MVKTKSNLCTVKTNMKENSRTYASMRTSGSDRFAEIRSVASKLNWLILNFCFISAWRSSLITTGRPISPGESGLWPVSTATHRIIFSDGRYRKRWGESTGELKLYEMNWSTRNSGVVEIARSWGYLLVRLRVMTAKLSFVTESSRSLDHST